ncbi:MAG TPA: ASCH domain-containing protein [Chloroflexota bacterium]|nr:ASCH domain-containing protein [Chloroflexota bacterium]
MRVYTLSLYQPWASLIAVGAKRVETRSWPTHYRGLLAIHATQRSPKADLARATQEPVASALRAAGYTGPDQLPHGAVVALCRLVDCTAIVEPPPSPERDFGDYRRGRYAWRLDQVWALPVPLPAHGHQRLWRCEVPAALVDAWQRDCGLPDAPPAAASAATLPAGVPESPSVVPVRR